MTRNRYISFGGYILFGKYNGERLEDVPSQYLRWMLTEVRDEMTSSERMLLDEEIFSRGMTTGSQGRSDSRTGSSSAGHGHRGSSSGYSSPPPSIVKLPAGVTTTDLLMVVSAGRQALAKRHHPDAGGDTRTMQRLNVAADWLEQSCRMVGDAK